MENLKNYWKLSKGHLALLKAIALFSPKKNRRKPTKYTLCVIEYRIARPTRIQRRGANKIKLNKDNSNKSIALLEARQGKMQQREAFNSIALLEAKQGKMQQREAFNSSVF